MTILSEWIPLRHLGQKYAGFKFWNTASLNLVRQKPYTWKYRPDDVVITGTQPFIHSNVVSQQAGWGCEIVSHCVLRHAPQVEGHSRSCIASHCDPNLFLLSWQFYLVLFGLLLWKCDTEMLTFAQCNHRSIGCTVSLLHLFGLCSFFSNISSFCRVNQIPAFNLL